MANQINRPEKSKFDEEQRSTPNRGQETGVRKDVNPAREQQKNRTDSSSSARRSLDE